MMKTLLTVSQDIDVTNFMEYQDYLKALYEAGKQHLESYSYLRFAEDLGFGATNVMRLTIAKKRRLSMQSARRIADAMKLKHKKRQYFLNLVQYNNMSSKDQKTELFLKVLSKKQEASEQADKALITYFSEWTHPVIRELVRLPHFQANAEWLQKNLYPTLKSESLEESLSFLSKQGMIKWNDHEQRYEVADTQAQIISQDAVSRSLSVLSFHQQMMELARQLILVVPKENREYNALTLRLRPEQWQELRQKIRSFCAEALAREEDPHPDDIVLQMNVQLFPYTKPQQKVS